MSLDIALTRGTIGTTLTLSLSNKSAETLTSNLDWILVMSYPSMAADGSFGYFQTSEPAFHIRSQNPDNKGWVTYALSRSVAEFSDTPPVPVYESKLVMHIHKLVYGEQYIVQLYDLRVSANSSTPLTITDNYARSKLLIDVAVSYVASGCITYVREVSYGSDSQARNIDLNMFYLSTWISRAVARRH